ncbi:Transcriptional regulatory protein OmpR [bioreactor metagenome]|uniref:Transcriptional regulatory protein OmpR n=1 Tax=bioreactor metagenome TaxID=1076179 RepID=A0A645BA83_9ZZZZ
MEEPLKVLFVDDDIDFGKINCIGLTALGYDVHFQTSLAGIEEVIKQFSPSIIVLDVEIGKENGIEKAREIILRFPSIPVLFISSHTDISSVSQGLAVGAVNYLKKPFDIRELDLYIKRFATKQLKSKEKSIGNYLFNTETRELLYDGFSIKILTPLEKNGLLLFLENESVGITYDLMSKIIWGKNYTPDLDSSIHNLISKLRKILNRDERIMINTVKGVGYIFKIRQALHF